MTQPTLLQPYRSPQPPEEPPEPKAALTTVSDLGVLRSRHAPAPQLGVLLANGAIALALLCVAVGWVSRIGSVAFILLLVSPALALVSIRWSRVSVDLHVDGLVFRTATGEHAIAFEDIDELWVEQAGGGALVSVHLVTHEGTRLQIPTSLERSADIFHALDRRFTQPLKRKALEAIVRGERLVFGAIGLDASGIDGGAWSLRWDQLSLVRVVNGQFAVFRGESILPSHTVRFDEVPHPWIFWALVTKLARATEVDDPRAFLGPPSHATLRPSGEK